MVKQDGALLGLAQVVVQVCPGLQKVNARTPDGVEVGVVLRFAAVGLVGSVELGGELDC